MAEDGEDHSYFNKKEPSPPPKPVKKAKSKLKNKGSVEKMLETKSKYFVMRHSTCCRTRDFEQNMEIKNKKMAAEKRFLEGPKKRGRKPKSTSSETAPVESEDPEVVEKLDPTWSPTAEGEATSAALQSSPGDVPNRRASFTASVPETITQDDIHKIHENRAPNKRRSAPPKRYSPEREVVQVKKRPKSPPPRRPRSPKERRRLSKSPVIKKRRSTADYSPTDAYFNFPAAAGAPDAPAFESTQASKERKKHAKQYEKRLKHEKPTLYAELMHVKKLKSVPMVVDHSMPVPLALLDHGYHRENKGPASMQDQYDDISYIHPDLSIVSTPDVADFEECLTDDVQISPPRPRFPHGARGTFSQHSVPGRARQRGRPAGVGLGRAAALERPRHQPARPPVPAAVRGIMTGGSVSTLQLSNSGMPNQHSQLGTLLGDDRRRGMNVRISGATAKVSPQGAARTVMAAPHDDSMEFDSDAFLPNEMHDDLLKVAADMFINENEITEEMPETSVYEHQISPASVQESHISRSVPSGSATSYPTPIVMTRPSAEQQSPVSTSGSSPYKRVITISQQGLVECAPLFQEPQSETVIQETVVQNDALVEDEADVSMVTVETVMEGQIQTEPPAELHSISLAEDDSSRVQEPSTVENEMAHELVQAILDHSRATASDLEDIQLNEVDYSMLLGCRATTSSNATVTTSAPGPTAADTDQVSQSVDHQYF